MNGVIVSTDPSGRRVATLRADDDIRFAKVFEAINAVVGTDYTGWMKATWPTPVKNEDSFYLWFPKLAEERDGELIPAANDCINTISDDWNEVIFEDLLLRHPESLRNETAYILIFAKETGGGDYVFRGVYLPDNEKSRPNYHVSRRVATEVQIIVSPDLHSSMPEIILPDEDIFEDVSGAELNNGHNSQQIDNERLASVAELLKKKILRQPSQTEPTVRFDRGFFWATEGYKYEVYDKCREILDFENWTPEMFATTEITDRVLKAFKKGSNLINFYTNDFRKRIEEDPVKAQSFIYDLYRGEDDYAAFCNFTSFFGNQYSKTAFLLFLKDRKKYLPIKPELFRKWLSMLDIDNRCTYGLTWDHYMEFIQIVRDIRERIDPMFDGPVSLLDAHSFVWCMYLLEQDFALADHEYVDYSDGEIHITKDQWVEVLQAGVLKEEYIGTLYKFFLAPDHTSTCRELGLLEQVSSSAYITPVVQMSKAVAQYLNLPSMQRGDGTGRWWPVLFLGRRLLDGLFEWRVRPELAEALAETSEEQIEECRYHLEERQSEIIDTDEVFAKASEASSQETRVYHTEVRRIQRNPYVSEWAKRRENGICLLCGNEGPFKEDRMDRAFLETHHIVSLADGGADSIYNVAALCPNCHRKMHHPRNESYANDLQFLKDCVEDFRRRDQE